MDLVSENSTKDFGEKKKYSDIYSYREGNVWQTENKQ